MIVNTFNIYMTGVGGQGIGLLSEVLIRATDKAGYKSIGVDTHGLAQRGGTVESHLRIGSEVYSPLIKKHNADLVIALERNEALRGIINYSDDSSLLVYYDAVWQPLAVRLGNEKPLEDNIISEVCKQKNVNYIRVYDENLKDARMQNMVVLARIAKDNLIPQVDRNHFIEAVSDVLRGDLLEKNIELFR